MAASAIRWWLPACVVMLSACSGTIQTDNRVRGDASRVEGFAQVSAVLTPEATRQLADSPQFNREELVAYMRRRLEGRGLLSGTASHRVEIVITDLRVRGTFAAVMFGFMAGDDHVNGRVRILDDRGQALRSFDVRASYAFGGAAGGDSTRMNWLYDKFTDLATVELQKVTRAPAVVTPLASATPTSPALAVPAPVPAAMVDVGSATVVAIDRVDAVPGLNEYGRSVYREWLTRRPPRAFVVASDGRFNATWGAKARDGADPADPAERALKQCRAGGKPGCTLYAVDDRVVYPWAPVGNGPPQ